MAAAAGRPPCCSLTCRPSGVTGMGPLTTEPAMQMRTQGMSWVMARGRAAAAKPVSAEKGTHPLCSFMDSSASDTG